MITNRIKKIASLVNKKVVAEIGADHGYITKYLFDTKKISNAVLTDISAKSLQKAKDNFENSQHENNVCFAVGDGLKALCEVGGKVNGQDVEQIIIAGMGAKEIINILGQNNTYTNFVLQPQKNVVELRKFLISQGYKIKKDVMVKDGKIFYNVLSVLKVEKNKQKLTKRQVMFGITNTKIPNADFCEYLHFKNAQYTQILKNSNSTEIQNKLKLIQKELRNVEGKKLSTK